MLKAAFFASVSLTFVAGPVLAAESPLLAEIGMEIQDGEVSQCKTIVTAPAGQRLLVESVSLDVSPGPGTQGQTLITYLKPKLGNKTISFRLNPVVTSDGGLVDSRQVRLYSDSTFRFCASRSQGTTGLWYFVVGVSGTLTDVP